MGQFTTLFAGLDVHKDSIVIGLYEAGRDREVRHLGTVAGGREAVAMACELTGFVWAIAREVTLPTQPQKQSAHQATYGNGGTLRTSIAARSGNATQPRNPGNRRRHW